MVFPTLAVQLARKYTKFRLVFIPLVRSDPEIAHESLYNQMDKLIVRPLAESAFSTVIIINALDECTDQETTSVILSVIGRLISRAPMLKLLLTGRPEPRIQTGFRLPLSVLGLPSAGIRVSGRAVLGYTVVHLLAQVG